MASSRQARAAELLGAAYAALNPNETAEQCMARLWTESIVPVPITQAANVDALENDDTSNNALIDTLEAIFQSGYTTERERGQMIPAHNIGNVKLDRLRTPDVSMRLDVPLRHLKADDIVSLPSDPTKRYIVESVVASDDSLRQNWGPLTAIEVRLLSQPGLYLRVIDNYTEHSAHFEPLVSRWEA